MELYPFIPAFILVLTFQYARCESYKEWYEKTVMHCIPGTKFQSYTPNFVCVCKMPGVVDDCQYVGMVRQAGDDKFLGLPNGKGNYDMLKGKAKQRSLDKKIIQSLKGKARTCKSGERFKEPSGCNWCTCIDNGVVVCDSKPCPLFHT